MRVLRSHSFFRFLCCLSCGCCNFRKLTIDRCRITGVVLRDGLWV